MAKRLTDPNKWDDPWFMSLGTNFQCLWGYLLDCCDHAGIWKINKRLADWRIGAQIEWDRVPEVFGNRIFIRGEYLFIPKFLTFQYGENLNRGDAVKSAVQIIERRGFGDIAAEVLGPPYIRVRGVSAEGPTTLPTGSQQGPRTPTATATATAIAKAKTQDVGGSGGFSFEVVWARYPRKLGRRAAERSFRASVKSPQDFLDIQNALDCFIRQMRKEAREEDKIQYGSTWFNNWRDWVNYGGLQMPKPTPPPPRPPDPPDEPLTEAEQIEMHKLTLSVLKKCPTKDCIICPKIKKLDEATHV